VLLAEKKNIKRVKARKKIGQKKRKKIAKQKRRDQKGAHKEHSIALLFVVPFTLSVFLLLSFILVLLPCVSQLVLGTRIGQQLGQVL
jgi:Flp pilus assembly protein TadB